MKLNLHDYPKFRDRDVLRKFYITIECDEFVKAFPYPSEYIHRGLGSRICEPALRMAEAFIVDMESNVADIPNDYLDRFMPPYHANKAEYTIVDSRHETVAYIDTAIVNTDPFNSRIECVDFYASYDADRNQWEIRCISDKEFIEFVDDTENIDDILDAMVKGIGFATS